METRRILFENEYIELYDEQYNEDVIATIHNKTDKDIVIKFGNYSTYIFELDDMEIGADGWQDLFSDGDSHKMFVLLVKGCFKVEIVEHKNELKDMQAFNEEIVRIVKKAINDNAFVCAEREFIFICDNEFDHIAEDVADNVCKLIAKGGN